MSSTIVSDRRASWPEVAAHRVELRELARTVGLTTPRLANDGTIIVHAPDRGYRLLAQFAAGAARVVGTYVHVITDDVPAADVDAPPL